MTTELSREDVRALGRALQAYRKLSVRHADEVRASLRSDGWTETVRHCARHMQQLEQGLSYEEAAPCDLSDDEVPVESDSAAVAMAVLLRRLIHNGLSRYEPFPARACEAAEQRRRESEGLHEEGSSAA